MVHETQNRDSGNFYNLFENKKESQKMRSSIVNIKRNKILGIHHTFFLKREINVCELSVWDKREAEIIN